MNTDSQWSKQEACFACAIWVWLAVKQSNSQTVSLLANEFNVRGVLHGQVSLAAVNQIYVIHGAMNGCRNLKIYQRLALKMLILILCLQQKKTHLKMSSAEYVLKRVSFGSRDCTKLLKPECAYFLGQTS